MADPEAHTIGADGLPRVLMLDGRRADELTREELLAALYRLHDDFLDERETVRRLMLTL